MATRTATNSTGLTRTRKPAQATLRTRGTAKTDPTPVVETPTGNACLCGCQKAVPGRYAQGHDARHVSQLLAAIAAGTLTYLEAVRELPSPNLQAKFQRANDRAQAKAQAARERQAKKAATPETTQAATDSGKEN